MGGGPPQTFPQGPPPFIVVQGGYLSVSGAGQARGLALDPSGQNLFFTTSDICWPKAGNVYQTPSATSGNTTLIALCAAPMFSDRIDASQAKVTWASEELISQVAPGAPGPYDNLVPQTAAGDFVWSSGTLYWTDQEAGELLSFTP